MSRTAADRTKTKALDAGLRGLFGRLEARPVPDRLMSIVDQLDAAEPPRRKAARG